MGHHDVGEDEIHAPAGSVLLALLGCGMDGTPVGVTTLTYAGQTPITVNVSSDVATPCDMEAARFPSRSFNEPGAANASNGLDTASGYASTLLEGRLEVIAHCLSQGPLRGRRVRLIAYGSGRSSSTQLKSSLLRGETVQRYLVGNGVAEKNVIVETALPPTGGAAPADVDLQLYP